MPMLIEGCHLYGPEAPSILIDEASGRNVATCTACGEVVYSDLVVLRNHDLHNWGDSARWFSRDLMMVVHRCGAQSATTVNADFSELTRA